MAFMSVMDITRIIIEMDTHTLCSIDALVKSFDDGDFFSRMNKALDVCKNEKIKKLIARISNCYMSYEFKESKEFIALLKKVLSSFYKPSPDRIKDFLLAISFFDDEKLQYDALKVLSHISVKDQNVKNQILFDILKSKYATVVDYNVVVSAWAQGKIQLTPQRLESLINDWLAAFIAYVSIRQPIDSFDFVMQQINKTLNDVATKSPSIAENIRVSYDIKPKGVFTQDEYINRFTGTNLIEASRLQKNISMCKVRNDSLRKTNSELRGDLEETSKLNRILQETLNEKNAEIKVLNDYIEKLKAQLRKHGVFIPAREDVGVKHK